MKQIEIDDDVFSELSKRASGFFITPNSVLRQILDLGETRNAGKESSNALPKNGSGLLDYVRRAEFLQHQQSVDKYLDLLSWLHLNHGERFSEAIEHFRRGHRVYFAKSQQAIEMSGNGSITAKPIPHSPFWALVTLDNRAKRTILHDILKALDYSAAVTSTVTRELPDSNIRRRRMIEL